MKLETFLLKFDELADAPNAVPKLRELILELAVQGRLVEQESTEGDGHALLKLIQQKNPPSRIETDAESGDAELPYFPNSWATSKLGEVAEIIRGVSFPGSAKSETRSTGDVACLRTASVQAEIDWDDLIYISDTNVGRADQWVAPNDILISMANSYALVGKVAIVREVPQKATFGAFLAAIRPILIEPYFLLYVLRSPRMQAAFRASSSQTTNIANISLGRMRPMPFPLPPLAEQKRIVAKVDELMALCDRLETQQQEREVKHAALAYASLARFGDGPTPANLDFLFHPSYAITPADLRKSILMVAVRGKLVPQDPNDEPATALVRRLVQFKLDNPLEGRSGRSKEATGQTSVANVDQPSTWAATTIGEVLYVIRGASPRPKGDPKYFSVTRTPYHWVKISDIRKHGQDGLLMDTDEFLTEAGMRKSVLLPKGTLVLTNSATIGVPIVLGVDGCCIHDGYLAFPNFPHALLSQRFLLYLFQHLKEHAEQNARGLAQLNLNSELVRSFPFGLPPLAEQHRIVARADELMDLVDQLEAQLTTSRSVGEKLMEAVVAELTAAHAA